MTEHEIRMAEQAWDDYQEQQARAEWDAMSPEERTWRSGTTADF